MMDETRFWQLVGIAGREDEEATLARMDQALQALSDDQLVAFQHRFDRIHAAAERNDLWAAAVLLNGGFCSDDGFTDFRSWLISRGRPIYEAALRDPDSLAMVDVEVDEDGPRAEFESFGYLAAEAWEARGLDEDAFHEALDAANTSDDEPSSSPDDPDFGEGECTDAALMRRLPALWAAYGRYKQAADQREPEPQDDPGTLTIQGLGAIGNGGTIEHRTFGTGTLSDLTPLPGGQAMANIQFADGRRPMLVDGKSGLWRLP